MGVPARRWLSIDTETTGLDVSTAGIVQLAASEWYRSFEGNSGCQTLNPGHPIPIEASRIHGITDELVADKPGLEDVAERFLARVSGAELLIGYNCWRYDFPLLERLLGERWRGAIAGTPQLDVFVLLSEFDWFKKGKSLGAACERWGVRFEGAHNALADARATARLLQALMKDRRFDRLPADPYNLEAVVRTMAADHEQRRQQYRDRQSGRPAA